MSTSLSDLAALQSLSEYGSHNTAMIWMILASILMFIGPAVGSLVYIFIRGERKAIWNLNHSEFQAEGQDRPDFKRAA